MSAASRLIGPAAAAHRTACHLRTAGWDALPSPTGTTSLTWPTLAASSATDAHCAWLAAVIEGR